METRVLEEEKVTQLATYVMLQTSTWEGRVGRGQRGSSTENISANLHGSICFKPKSKPKQHLGCQPFLSWFLALADTISDIQNTKRYFKIKSKPEITVFKMRKKRLFLCNALFQQEISHWPTLSERNQHKLVKLLE